MTEIEAILARGDTGSDMYRMKIICTNCGTVCMASITKGERIDAYCSNRPCERCGCSTLRRYVQFND